MLLRRKDAWIVRQNGADCCPIRMLLLRQKHALRIATGSFGHRDYRQKTQPPTHLGFIFYAQTAGTLGISMLNGLLLVGLLLRDGGGFLRIKRHGRGGPRLVHIPFRLAFYLPRIVIHGLGLPLSSIIARVPHAIMVVIDEQTQVIGVGDDIEKLCAPVGSPRRFHHLVALVEQRPRNLCPPCRRA